ncbi:MAG: hypothetical protein GX455_08880 [Phycisphaerae bacterium]|nr:hypothetical protein [Phycisphaerae bacterium]
MNKQKIARFGWIVLFIGCLPLGGCSNNAQQSLGQRFVSNQDLITKEELRDHLDGLADSFKVSINSIAEEIIRKSPNKSIKMQSLETRIQLLYALNAILQEDDSVAAFLNTWALCIRFRLFLEEGEGTALFGENHGKTVEASRNSEKQIEEIGKLFLTEAMFNAIRNDLYEFARANPVRLNMSNLVMYPTDAKKTGGDHFLSILTLPMEPFRAIGGVDRTATAIGRFTDTADRFTDILAELPETSRWQLLLFLYELEESETMKSLVASTAALSESSKQLAATSEQLPENIRKQLSVLLDEVDTKQKNLQVTLVQAEKMAEMVKEAMNSVTEASVSLDATAMSVTETADTWKQAAHATGQAIKEAAVFQPKPGDPPSTFNIRDYQDTARAVTQAASELRAATAELRLLADPQWISKVTSILVWRIAELMGTLLASLLVYRVIVKKKEKV